MSFKFLFEHVKHNDESQRTSFEHYYLRLCNSIPCLNKVNTTIFVILAVYVAIALNLSDVGFVFWSNGVRRIFLKLYRINSDKHIRWER